VNDPFVTAFLVLMALLAWWIIKSVRQSRRMSALIKQIRLTNPLVYFNLWQTRYRLERVGGKSTGWRSCVLAVTRDGLAVYPKDHTMRERFRFRPDELHWFGRPVKYSSGTNEIWLHVENGSEWNLLKIKLSRDSMMKFVRALKQIATPDQVMAYRRRRPYIHRGPLLAYPADEDLDGEGWLLDNPVDLYLMPSALVIMRGGRVLRTFALESIQQVGALSWTESPYTDGLVRFQMEGEKYAFAMQGHAGFADALAEAAKRTLEDPVMRWGKSKKHGHLEADDEEYDQEDFIELMDDAEEYLGER
jgi:hypothetical protein